MKFFTSFLFAVPAFAFAQDAAPSTRSGMFSTLMMIGLAMVFFYFILWRPEQKRRKAGEKMRSSLKKGDRVTAMGIVGTVVRVQEQTVILKMVDGAKIEMLKAAITDVQPGTEESEKTDISSDS
ncbi:MAG: yajC [Parachlamydiales bacterium]|nr:yajC [Parachlamydiales bacterium]